jgi:glutamate N-acetyltransferase/amino-acid N-acetyltransferase
MTNPHITLVPGFRASGVTCGLKKGDELDLALIAAEGPCTAAAMFTKNRVRAAPVLYDQRIIQAGNPVQAVVINSGCANACTGEQGLRDARRMAEMTADRLGLLPDAVLVMSTGVIGQLLPMDKVAAGIELACQELSHSGGGDAARAIMTTDTRPKEAATKVEIAGETVTIAGMCKGAGMIHPDMATMLAVLVTDAAIERDVLQHALRATVERTFNMVTVDGDTSTNDTVLLLANGQAENPVLSDVTSSAYRVFENGLLAVSTALAQGIARDGEGASKFITVQVTGAANWGEAKQVAKSIASSTLVKTAVYGEDANWGRVVCAAGYSGVQIEPERLSLWMENRLDSLHLVRRGEPFEIDETRASAILAETEVTFRLELGEGSESATAWTCDLTHAYVDVNAHYRT